MFNQMKQQELIQSLSQRELYLNLYLTQGIFLILTVILSILFGQTFAEWRDLFQLDWITLLFWSVPVALFVVFIDVWLWLKVPKKWIDDGGINNRIFARISVPHLLIVSIVIGLSEELLFRGLLQENIGYVASSLLFAFMHVRYLSKPVLFIFVTALSFLLGWVFILTETLLIPIVIHILIDFVLGLIIRFDFFSIRSSQEHS
ncbi:CPBP family intramembrane glutamic endopeptidase [Pseudalkalibacillus berkeleyi]|uniref:CPBP family intramembrane metalloprotease n=1 Tax=Pseudalkalibacillus berkeleyi TaxID=1069813 RepID=A0ABS9H102_9BACL|nr:type II CAAX endopeptidase family protein [Pseudalkalibacillus berkeleyi]MCF6137610.1 CPBP family intramembrane metalloprotease [Pseudalkalibacillus berkeleyi]